MCVKATLGIKLAELPIEQPTKVEFVLNLQTAQTFGLTIPQSVLQQATEVVQYFPFSTFSIRSYNLVV